MANRKINLLVLDDDPWNMTWLEDFAAAEGAMLSMVTTFDEAVSEARKRPPDVAVVDVMIGAAAGAVGNAVGATLASVPEDWVGLRFVRFLRKDLARSRDVTSIIVYTVLDRAELAKIVEDAFQGVYCIKSDVRHFRDTLAGSIARFRRK